MPQKVVLCILLVVMLGFAARAQDTEPSFSAVRFAHFSPDTPPLDIYLDGTLIDAEDFSFGSVTPWLELSADTHSITLVPTGTGISDAVFGPTDYTFDPNGWTTLAVIGLAETDSVSVRAITEDYSELPAGEARISFLHAAPGAPPLDLIANGDALLQFVNFTGDTIDGSPNEGFVTVDVVANTYDMLVTAADNPETVLADLGEVQFAEGANTLLAVIGGPGDVRAVVVTSDVDAAGAVGTANPGETAHWRVAHLSSGTPEIDVYVNGVLSRLTGLSFPTVTEFVNVEPGTVSISISPAATSFENTVLGPLELTLAEGDWITVTMIGTLSNSTLELHVVVEDFSPLPPQEVRVSVFNAVSGISPINVQLGDGTLMLRLLGYPGSQGDNDGLSSFQLPAGPYDLEFYQDGNTETPYFTLEDRDLDAGRHYFIAVIVAEPPYLIVSEPLEMLPGAVPEATPERD
jgi:hypothetical protein